MAFVAEHGLAYRGGGRHGHLLLAPAGEFVLDPSTEVADLVLAAGGIEIRALDSEVELADGAASRVRGGHCAAGSSPISCAATPAG